MKMRSWSRIQAILLRGAVYLSAVLTAGILICLVIYILVKGIPHLSFNLFSFTYTTENVSMFPALINTITITLLSLLIAVPLGIFSALYLVEYAKRGNRLVSLVRLTAETLAGIPSIVYGLFGFLLFVTTLGFGYSLLAGALTLAIMILPVIMRTTEEALMSVRIHTGRSFGLGAGSWTIFRIVLPAAMPGILAGVVLSVGRIVGETAALIYTAGSVAQIPANLLGSGRTLSVHMYALWTEGLYVEQSYATAVVLLIIVIGLNTVSASIAKRLGKGKV